MGRVPMHQMKPRKPPILDTHIQNSIDMGMSDEGHYGEIVIPGAPGDTEELAKEVRRALFRSASHLGVSLKCDIEPGTDGTFQIRYHAIHKTIARAYIAKKTGGDPAKLAYNPYVRQT